MPENGARGANNTRNTRQKGRGHTRDARHMVLKVLYVKPHVCVGAVVKAHVFEGVVEKA